MGEHWCGLFQWQAAMVFSPWQDCQRRVPENVAGIEVVAAYFEPGKSKWKFPIRGQTI